VVSRLKQARSDFENGLQLYDSGQKQAGRAQAVKALNLAARQDVDRAALQATYIAWSFNTYGRKAPDNAIAGRALTLVARWRGLFAGAGLDLILGEPLPADPMGEDPRFWTWDDFLAHQLPDWSARERRGLRIALVNAAYHHPATW